jgi:WS/DGAT/MGAT family acyltransferase
MSPYAYDRLTALDSSFLVLEDPNSYLHMGSVLIFENGPLRTPEGGIDFERIVRATESVLHRVPRYRQKLRWIPLENHPVWVDDGGFNIHYHVRHTSLPKPGTVRQLKRLSARILSQHLDQSKPLWENWVVEGLEGDRFAVISKIHHSMADGVAGADLLATLLRTTPDDEIPHMPPFAPRRAPSGAELLRGEFMRRAGLPFQLIRDWRASALGPSRGRRAADLRDQFRMQARAVADTVGKVLRPPSETPLNQPIGSHRRFDWFTMELDEVKRIAKELHGTLNDVVLATVTGAVRSFMIQRGADPAAIDFRVLAPVSVRAESERGSLGNRISAWIVDLPIGEPEVRTRFARIAEQVAGFKRSNQASAAELLTRLGDWTSPRLISLGARSLAQRRLPFNMVVTNVPGPQIPLFLLGSSLMDLLPCVPITGHLGLGVALFSYDGKLCWGFNADWEQLPDLHGFIELTEFAFDDLRSAAGMGRFSVRRLQ